jgi:hypothetical protein
MIQGRVTNVGTMIVNGEELTGIFIETTKAALTDTPLPLYQDCFVGWWRPIEGAPTDGRRAMVGGEEVVIAHHDQGAWWWSEDDGIWFEARMWSPLPPEPLLPADDQ